MAENTEFYVGKARDGSESAFCALYERVAPALLAWSRIRTSGPIRKMLDPEDLMQEVWWRAIENFPKFDPERSRFRGWLFGIANNVYLQALRKRPESRASRPGRDIRFDTLTGELQAKVTSITAHARRSEHVEQLVLLAATLSADERRLLIALGLEGRPQKETADVFGISQEVIKKRWQRLRKHLVESIGGELLFEGR